MPARTMRKWWEEVGKPSNWAILNLGEGNLSSGSGRLRPGQMIGCVGEPGEGWATEGREAIKVGLLVKGMEREGEGLMLGTVNVQGWGEESQTGVVRWMQDKQLDWVVGTEHQQKEWGKRGFAGRAVRATCLPRTEAGGRTGGGGAHIP